jgi:phage-related protein
VRWSFVFLNLEVKAELDALPEDVRASFQRIVRLVQAVGLERVHEPLYQASRRPHLGNAATGEGRHRRGSLCDGDRRAVAILRVFTKKTQETPRREIELARQRAKEMT